MAKTDRQKVGDWGEEIACRFLERKGYAIVDRNVREKWGEIDIICRKTPAVTDSVPRGTIGSKKQRNVPRGTFWRKIKQFFTPKRQRNPQLFPQAPNQSKYGTGRARETLVFVEVKTLQTSAFNPAESVTPAKQKRIIRSCQAYLRSERLPKDTDWQIDVIGIVLDREKNRAQVEHLEQAVHL